ncbi:MAG: hypothetical protein BGO03_07095 [Mesorhizobium sp. 61-13]|nr:MAG: hypothetical protein BGO03_07095 [Mesorhizobium sp. 61-13]
MARLDHLNVTFHAKLGTQGQRVERIRRLAERVAMLTRCESALAGRAAVLAKADLTTEIVGEFPELQGAMGRKYALLQGEDASVAAAIEDHYKPQGPSDRVPTDPVSVAVALADKLDTLVGFWAIDEKPTGSKDPFALRRAALGVIRIVLERELRLQLVKITSLSAVSYFQKFQKDDSGPYIDAASKLASAGLVDDSLSNEVYEQLLGSTGLPASISAAREMVAGVNYDLLSFFHDRLKVYLRDQGARHDLIDAVITPESDDLLMIVRRVEALGKFLETDDGKNLLAGTKRAANILAAEEKKGTAVADAVQPALFKDDAEKKLFDAVNQAENKASEAIQKEDFSGAMLALSVLREPVDSFFEQVLVNDDDLAVRANRLALLTRIRAATDQVADFSKIAG